ncbi:MAG: type I-C CRISPR-associated protein Cas8c/Csd1, partial [Pseudonocardiaceae bacterium]
MFLQRLVEYADRLDLPPALYSEGPVRYLIELDAAGRLRNREPTDTADPSSPHSHRGVRRLVPQVQRTVGIKPLLLADKAAYTLGVAPDDGGERVRDRAQICHQTYVELVDRCAAATAEPAVEAVRTFLHNDPLGQLELPADFDPSAIITFRVNEIFPIDLPPVQAFWASEHDPAASGRSAAVMQCLVCGEHRPVLERLQGKIKGVPGGQSSGTAIISANAPAFESYGLEASLIAPTCARCGEKFTKAANALLANEQQRRTLGSTAFIFWTREDVEFSFMELLMNPRAEDFQTVLDSIWTGRGMQDIKDVDFYAAALVASGGRAAVRDWIDTTVGSVLRQLAGWFGRQRIVGRDGQQPTPLGIPALALATVREANDLAPTVPRALLRGALTGGPLPPHLLYEAVRRNRAEQGVTRPRAALAKLVLLSQDPTRDRKEDLMVGLDRSNPDPAYHCGRLLAVLEAVQRLALPKAKATIVDRFYGTASSAPALVFGRLLRGAMPHLSKLGR